MEAPRCRPSRISAAVLATGLACSTSSSLKARSCWLSMRSQDGSVKRGGEILSAYPTASPDRLRSLWGTPDRSTTHRITSTLSLARQSDDLDDPLSCIREMVHIARPGGLIACVEPNNFMNMMNMDSLSEAQTVESQVQKYEFWLRYHRGRMKNGLGNDAIGELVPGMFAALGLTGIRVYESDRAAPHFPPYAGEEQRVLLEQYSRSRAEGSSQWDHAEVARHVRAGGGNRRIHRAGMESPGPPGGSSRRLVP